MIPHRLSFLVVICGACSPLSAAVITWTNGTGTGLWNTGLNWSTGAVPGVADVALFDGTSVTNCAINAVVNVQGIRLAPTYTGTVTQGVQTITMGTAGFVQNRGIFIGSNSAITISGGVFVLTAGNFTSTSGTLRIGGTQTANVTLFTHSGGLFTHNHGLVEFDPFYSPCAWGTFTLDVIPATQFYDLKMNGSGTCGTYATFATAAGDTADAAHDLTHENGFLSGLFSTKNDLWIGASADAGSGQIIFDGMVAQQYHVASPAQRTCFIVVNQISGMVTPAAGTTAFSMQGYWHLQGKFMAPSGTMKIGGTETSNLTLFYQATGTFLHNNGLVELDPFYSPCAWGTFTLDVTPSTQFYDLKVNGSGTCGTYATFATAAGDTADAVHDLTQENGFLSGLFSTKNDLWIGTSADGGSGQIIFDGTGAQQYHVATTTRSCFIVVNKTSGGVTPAAGTTAFSMQGYSQLQGDFTAPSGAMNIGGTEAANLTLFRHAAGTFSPNNGLVELDPFYSPCAWGTFTIDVIPSTQFYDLKVNGSGTCGTYATIATAANDTADAAHDLTQENGCISGLFSVKRDLWIGTSGDGGSGQIIFDGTGAQQYHVATTTRSCFIVVNKTSGGVTPAAGTTAFSMQGYLQWQGDFTAPSGTMTIGGTETANVTLFRHAAGTFSHNNGLVELDPFYSPCAWGTFTIDVIPSTQFYDLKVNGSGTCGTYATFATAAGDTADAAHDLTQENGFLSGLFSTKNDLWIGSSGDGGSGQIIFDGTGAQQYHVATATRSCFIVVNKTSGGVTPAAGTTAFSMQGYLQWQGNFTAPSGTMTIGGTETANLTLFRHAAGTFSHNNGLVELDPFYSPCAWGTFTIDVIPSTQFYDLKVNGSGTCGTYATIATAAGDTADAAHDLTQENGFLSGLFSTKNDLWIGSSADGGSGQIIFDGTGAQQYHVATATRSCFIVVNKTSGGVTPAAGTTAFSMQGYLQWQGNFTAPSGTMTIGGTETANLTLFRHAAGTFSHNNGLVELDPFYSPCAWGTFTIDVIPSTQFYDLKVNGSGTCGTYATIATAANDTADAAHDLTQENGFISGLFSVKRDLWIGTSADGGSGQIIFDGTGAQQYHIASPATRSCFVVVNKTSGGVTPAAGTTAFSMQGYTQLQGDFTAPSGAMNVGGTEAANLTLFRHAAGTFSHNNGLVELDPFYSPCAWGTFTIDVIPSTQFYDLKVNGSGTCGTYATIATAAGDTADAVHDLTHENGFLSGLFSTKNDLWVGTSGDGGSGQIIFDGTAAQQYHIASPATRSCFIVVNKTSGGVTPAAGTTAFSMQGFTQLQGNFTAPSGAMNVGGTETANLTLFRHAAGTFSHNNGLVEFDPFYSPCAQGTFTVDVIPATQFYDLKVNGSNACGLSAIFSIPAADSLDAAGYLDLNNGTVNTGSLQPRGNVFVRSTYDSGSSLLVFSGNAAQQFDLTGATGLYNGDIKLAKTGQNVTLLSGLLMDAASQDLFFSKGDLVGSAANLVTIGDNVNSSGASDSSFVDGPVRKVGNDLFIFPVGDADTLYAPIRIGAPGSTTDQFTAEYFHADPDPLYARASKVAALDHIGACEYWNLVRNVGASNVPVTLSWAARSCGVTNLCQLAVARWNGTQWVNHGNGGTTGSAASGTVITGTVCSSTGTVSAFGPFTLSSTSGNNPLPIELVSFEAIARTHHVDLKWVTASEQNNAEFVVEKTRDGVGFENVVSVPGAGNSQSTITYQDVDPRPWPGISYYRLRQIDLDGTSTLSDLVAVEYSGSDADLLLYPNPSSNGQIWMDLNVQVRGSVQVDCLDASGRTVGQWQQEMEAGAQHLDLRTRIDLRPGSYTIRVMQDGRSSIAPLVVL